MSKWSYENSASEVTFVQPEDGRDPFICVTDDTGQSAYMVLDLNTLGFIRATATLLETEMLNNWGQE